MIEYRTKGGKTGLKPTLGVDINEEDLDDNMGWCLRCGETVDGVEPDARKYVCECCKEPSVYGLSELMLMGLVDASESD